MDIVAETRLGLSDYSRTSDPLECRPCYFDDSVPGVDIAVVLAEPNRSSVEVGFSAAESSIEEGACTERENMPREDTAAPSAIVQLEDGTSNAGDAMPIAFTGVTCPKVLVAPSASVYVTAVEVMGTASPAWEWLLSG